MLNRDPQQLTGQLTGQIAGLARAGLPLSAGLHALASDLPAGRQRRALLEITGQLEAGQDLATILRERHAPPELAALVEAGVRIGRLDLVLQEYALCVLRAHEIPRAFGMMLAYPLVLLVWAALAMLFLGVVVLPRFVEMYREFAFELPIMTVYVIKWFEFVRDYWQFLGTAGVLLAAGGWFALRWEAVRWKARLIARRLPLLGPLLRWMAMSRFSRYLALLVSNDVPLPAALELAGAATGDIVVRTRCRQLAASVVAGTPLFEAARALRLFPESFLQVWKLEPEQGDFADALRAISDAGLIKSRMQTMAILCFLEPAIITAIGIGAWLVVVALFLPLLRLLTNFV